MFSCLCAKPAPAVSPQGEPSTWSEGEVKAWFATKEFYGTKALKGVDGKVLLSMEESKWTKLMGARGAAVREELVKLVPTEAAAATADVTAAPIAADAAAQPAECGDAKPAEWGVQGSQGGACTEAPADALDAAVEDQGPKLPIEGLCAVFTAFACIGTRDMGAVVEMDSSKFVKLARDCELMDEHLKETDVDLIFLKSRASKEKRRISFKEFLSALEKLAEKKGVSVEALADMIVAKGGPSMTDITRPEMVRLHDDRSTYTGVYKQGGPSSADAPDLAAMLNRDRAESRRQSSAGSRMSSNGGGVPDASPASDMFGKSVVMSVRRATMEGTPQAPVTLHDAFTAFANFGKAPQAGKPVGMANSKFVKLLKETGIIDGSFDTTAADIVFSRTKAKGTNTISFREFKECLKAQAQQIASLVDVVSLLVSRVPGAPMQMPHAEPARARAGHAAHSAAPRAAPAAEAAQPARPAAAAAPVASAGGGPATERPASGATRAASARGPSRRGGLPARVGDTSLRRSFVLSIPVARGANWFLAGGGRRMDEEEATAAAAERIAAAAEDGTSLPVRLATDVVRFLYGGTGRREPADGGVVSASLLNTKHAVGGIGVEPCGGAVLRVLFTVASDAVADTVVRWRHELCRCVDSTAVFDVHSDREDAQHQALWPAFLAAKVAGKRAQFHRARLVVDGERSIAALKHTEVLELSSSITRSGGPMLNTACA
ncbi:hypothetical protein FOA52_007313 [Chlamydomonas sp. UWO 241]|nr:hypothetical protein FOA52_007313 [Chlamydomonas sp. UWO 241]